MSIIFLLVEKNSDVFNSSYHYVLNYTFNFFRSVIHAIFASIIEFRQTTFMKRARPGQLTVDEWMSIMAVPLGLEIPRVDSLFTLT